MKVEMSFHNRYYPWTEVSTGDVSCRLKVTFFYENELLQNDDIDRLFSSVFEGSRIDHEVLRAHSRPERKFCSCPGDPRHIFCAVDRVRVFLFYAVSGNEALFLMMRTISETA